MFEQAFKNIDDILRREGGGVLKYTEQSSWLLFLKYLDALEEDRATEAALEGKKYTHILEKPYRWSSWAAPKDKNGQLDHNKALTGDDLRDFVNLKLCPYLKGFKQRASGPNTIEYKIGEHFLTRAQPLIKPQKCVPARTIPDDLGTSSSLCDSALPLNDGKDVIY
jgi:type I restriction enzyme M protein